jgi:CheY-like chemotaxis protein
LAVDGEDALEKFEPQRFDLIICDVFMPHKEGLQTIRELRELAPSMPIVSMTGSIPSSGTDQIDPDFLRITAEFGANRTIAKPFKAAELIALVHRCLEEGRAPTAG